MNSFPEPTWWNGPDDRQDWGDRDSREAPVDDREDRDWADEAAEYCINMVQAHGRTQARRLIAARLRDISR